MNRTIFINKIIEPILFANQLIEFALNKHNLVEITLFGKIFSADKIALKETLRLPSIRNLKFKNYCFKLDMAKYRNISQIIEKYFCQDWGLIFKKNQTGLFSYKMKVISIDCNDIEDLNGLKELFVHLKRKK